jgi:hypothetical protein
MKGNNLMQTRFQIRQAHIVLATDGAWLQTFEGGKINSSFIGKGVRENTLRDFATSREIGISETTELKEREAR